MNPYLCMGWGWAWVMMAGCMVWVYCGAPYA